MGMTYNLKIWSKNMWETREGVNGCGKEQQIQYLERQSTTTMIKKFLHALGGPSMKYKEILLCLCVGNGSGCSGP